jgi:tripartite-type tricarboxylate transporter receptor subunit TctC
MKRLKRLLFAALLGAAPLATCGAAAFPDHPIQLYVPFGAGGSIDVTARALATAAQKILGAPVLVVNKPGAGGAIALAEVARAKPDGYTLGVIMAANGAIAPQMQKVPYDAQKDFSIIANYALSTIYVAVRADSPYKTLNDLLADMKANPGKILVGITTLGATTHLSTARMMRERGLQTDYVTFGGGAQVITALLGGHISVATLAGEALPYVTSGKIRFLASFAQASVPALADVPSIQASGFNWEADSWVGLAAPAGLPEAQRKILETAFIKAAADPDYLRVVAEMAMVSQPMPGEQLRKTMVQSYRDIGELIHAIGLVQ